MMELLSILVVAMGIGMLIFIHEGGHYICARLIGVRVQVFSLGFGPRLFGFRRGDTDYRLSAVPLGGYVRVAGEDYVQREHLPSDHLHAKGLAARALFFSGGVAMNLLFGVVAFILVFHSGVQFIAPEVGGVSPGGAAWEAGLEPGDRILTIDGKEMYSWPNLVTEVALSSSATRLRYERGGRVMPPVMVSPHYIEGAGMPSLGIGRPIDPKPPALDVLEDGPAARAGMRDGDRLTAIDGRSLDASEVFAALTEAEQQDREVEIGFLRDGEPRTLGVRPEPNSSSPYQIGVLLAAREVIGLRPVPAVTGLGIERGDVILSVGGVAFYGESMETTLAGSGDLVFAVRRENRELDLTLENATEDQRQALAANLALRAEAGSPILVPRPGGAAAAAGIQAGDEVRAIDGDAVDNFEDLRQAVLGSEGRALKLTLARAGVTVEVDLVAASAPNLGLEPILEIKRQLFQKESLGAAIGAGMVCSVDLIKQLYVTLKRIVTGDVAARNLGGIITISRVTYQSAQGGAAYFFYFLALLSINLAFINVLPIPVLDGGHLLFVLIERIKGSPVSTTVLNYSQIMGLVFVLALIVFVTYNDILRLL